jgi:hypothetical protein
MALVTTESLKLTGMSGNHPVGVILDGHHMLPPCLPLVRRLPVLRDGSAGKAFDELC